MTRTAFTGTHMTEGGMMKGALLRLSRLVCFLWLCCGSQMTATLAIRHPDDRKQTRKGAKVKRNPGKMPPAAAASPAQQLMACYNVKHVANASTFQQYSAGRPTRSMRLHHMWWSPRNTSVPLTIFTTTDMGRLEALAAQCRSFLGGPLVASVYVPLIIEEDSDFITEESDHPSGRVLAGNKAKARSHHTPKLSEANSRALRNATKALDEFFHQMEAQAAADGSETCVLRLMLLYELVEDEVMAALFPINALRNAAMLAATTPLAAMVDVDLSISRGLVELLKEDLGPGSRAAELLRRAEQQRVAWVMPAWDSQRNLSFAESDAVANAVVTVKPGDKEQLRTMWQTDKMIIPFASDRYARGHQQTDYERWVGACSDYRVEYSPGYEPWFMASRVELLPYDARFRGYFYNKVVGVSASAVSGLAFWVMHDAWLAHRAHPPAASSISHQYNELEKQLGAVLEKEVRFDGGWKRAAHAFVMLNRRFLRSSTALMWKGRYRPVVDEASRHCRSVLTWWRRGNA